MPEIRTKTIHDAMYQVLIDCLRAARQSRNTTQVELATRLGTDQSYVSKYERAERRLDIIELRSICSALTLDFVEFISSFETELRKQDLL